MNKKEKPFLTKDPSGLLPDDVYADWRIMGQTGYLMDQEVVYRRFDREICYLDFTQCEFCWDVFDEDPANPDFAYHVPAKKCWICKKCFKDFQPYFHWKEISPPQGE